MKVRAMAAAAACVVALAGCGGGGGGGGSPSGGGGSAAKAFAVSGVAAKGLLKNAIVTAYPIVNGVADFGRPLASTRTSSTDGSYRLALSVSADPYYVVQVTADAQTTHADETTGDQTLPSGFKLRALVQPSPGGDVTAYVTPFSDMAYAAAAGAAGGLSTANIQAARANVRQLLGFDPQAVAPRRVQVLDDQSTQEERVLAAMLTAVSQMAKDGELGCSGTPAARTDCIVGKLATSYTLNSTLPAAAEKAALLRALDKVGRSAEYGEKVGGVSSAIATAIAGDDGTPLPGNGNAAAIATTKALFNDLLSVARTLFVPGSSGTGPVQAQVEAFQDSVGAIVRPSAEVVLSDAAILLAGVELFDDFKAGRSTETVAERNALGVSQEGTWIDGGDSPDAQCWLTDANGDTTTQRATAAQAQCMVRVGSRLEYGAYTSQVTSDGSGGQVMVYTSRYVRHDWYHEFVVRPGGTGKYDYDVGLISVDTPCTQITKFPYSYNSSQGYSNSSSCDYAGVPFVDVGERRLGQVEPSFVAGGLRAFTILGELPQGMQASGGFAGGVKAGWVLNGSIADAAGARRVIRFSGQYKTVDAAGKDVLKAAIGQATINGKAVGNSTGIEADALGEAEIQAIWTAGSAEVAGSLRADTFARPVGSSDYVPGRVSFSGSLSNIPASGTATPFFAGTLEDSLVNLAGFDRSRPISPTNRLNHNLAFVGRVTAPGKPAVDVRLSVQLAQNGSQAAGGNFNGQLRTLSAAGTPLRAVNLTDGKFGSGNWSGLLSDAGTGVSFAGGSSLNGKHVIKDATGAEIGVIDYDKQMATFTNGEFMSLR